MLTVDGLATGLDTGTIIEGLLEVQKAQVDRFNVRKQEIVDQQAAFRSVEARLLELQTSISSLRRFGDNVFLRKQAESSDEAVEVSVSNAAAPGTYTIRVNTLAQSHQIASNAFSASDQQIAKGTFTILVGSGSPVDIKIDDTNNTLEGLARDINSARNGVAATILNDGSSYRLLLASNQTGAENLISVSFDQAPGDTSQAATFDFENPVQAPTDASIVFGSGSGAVTVVSANNQVDDVLPGVTMNLLRSDPEKPISLTVSADVEPAAEAIQGFVDAYNGVLDFIDEQQRFDPETSTAGLLNGDRSILKIRDRVVREVSSVVVGAKREMNRLRALGIRSDLDSRNRLSIRSNELDDALNGRVEGVGLEDVQKLFSVFGETNSAQIRFLQTSAETQASPAGSPYQVRVLQNAEQARISAGVALPNSVKIDAKNDEFVIAVDGRQSDLLRFTHGRYTRQELADHLETMINGDAALAGGQVSVSLQNDQLEIITADYGLSSELEIISGTSLARLGFAIGDYDKGQDVVGEFLAEGEVETAAGQGRVLTGRQAGGFTQGLQIRVASQVEAGLLVDVTVTRGIAAELNDTLNSLLEFNDGDLSQVDKRLREQIDSIDQNIDRLNARFEAEQQSLILEFARLETTVSELQAMGNALAAQLGGLPAIGI